MRFFTTVVVSLTAVYGASAKNVFVQVGGNTTSNATMVFQPAQIIAAPNDIVVFNFTQGNHTVTQAAFGSPCQPIHDTNVTVNGFNSGFRDTVNGTAVTILSVPITPDLQNQTIWFFDFNTCGQGGVGGINIDDNSTATLDGFIRNAVRLNGTDAQQPNSTASSSISTASHAPSPTTSPSGDNNNAAEHRAILGTLSVIPLIVAAIAL
ncbi:hypothetical protein QCA50_005291 [Cerrena zonata]|uniref:Cupredoxin n=1 Tax=Cerrena zonata TaxID=2478898 RepID=A0AAW0GPQ4_9APHY